MLCPTRSNAAMTSSPAGRREQGVRQMDRRGAVLLAGRKGDDLALAGQRRLAAAEVGNQPVDRLVAVIGMLLQQLEDDGRQHSRHVRANTSGASGSEAIW